MIGANICILIVAHSLETSPLFQGSASNCMEDTTSVFPFGFESDKAQTTIPSSGGARPTGVLSTFGRKSRHSPLQPVRSPFFVVGGLMSRTVHDAPNRAKRLFWLRIPLSLRGPPKVLRVSSRTHAKLTHPPETWWPPAVPLAF